MVFLVPAKSCVFTPVDRVGKSDPKDWDGVTASAMLLKED